MRLARLEIENLKALRHLRLPEDGMGWGEDIPDVVLIGGANGSGKTTLLEVIVGGMESLAGSATFFHHLPLDARYTLDFHLRTSEWPDLWFRTVLNDGNAIHDVLRGGLSNLARWCHVVRDSSQFRESTIPSLLYIPSTSRELVTVEAAHKHPGQRAPHDQFVYRWQPPSGQDWSETFEAQLYGTRWEDLNAKEEGRPEDATQFARYADAFAAFFPGKRLSWHKSELVIEVAGSSARHGLDELSSGEKQILLFLGQLLDRWRPGSMVLIDEPETHLHPSLQLRFFDTLCKWRQERGGQLIVATQSNHLFGHAPPGTKLLLSEPL